MVDLLEMIVFLTVAVAETAGIRGFVLFLGVYIQYESLFCLPFTHVVQEESNTQGHRTVAVENVKSTGIRSELG